VRVVQRRRALYGVLIYLQGYRVGFCFSYGFYRNKVVLLPETYEPFPHSDTDEPEVPVVVYVDVHHLTDEAGPGVENAPLAEFALGGTRVLGVRQPGEVHGDPPSLRRQGSAPHRATTVRSGAIRP
jgi:hypothetical protein